MPTTYDSIATTTIASSGVTTQIDFTSIPGTYTDLRLVTTGTNNGGGNLWFSVNADFSAIYFMTSINGNGTSPTSTNSVSANQWNLNRAGNTSTTIPTMYTMDFFSYAGSTHKTCLMTESSDLNGSGGVSRSVGLYQSTSAITALRLWLSGGASFNAGTTATLYGIKAA